MATLRIHNENNFKLYNLIGPTYFGVWSLWQLVLDTCTCVYNFLRIYEKIDENKESLITIWSR